MSSDSVIFHDEIHDVCERRGNHIRLRNPRTKSTHLARANEITPVDFMDNMFQAGTTLFETYGDEYDLVSNLRDRVWTLLDDGYTILKGIHHVNALGYFIEKETDQCPMIGK